MVGRVPKMSASILLISRKKSEALAHFFVMAGQEGLEPPTPGFGVRCSTIRATGLSTLLRFFMQGMISAERAKLLELQLVRSFSFVLRRRIVTMFAGFTT